MDNYAIADQLSLLSSLMDIHGENSFKSKTYSSAAFTVEKFPKEFSSMEREQLFAIRGIGESVGKKIMELLQTGEIAALQELIAVTPAGVLEMMHIKGLGAKKIHTIWKGMGIDTIDALRTAGKENRLAAQKGFGAKTEEKILEALAFREQTARSFLFAQVEPFATGFSEKLAEAFPKHELELSGAFRRQLEVIDKLEWVTTIPRKDLKAFLLESGMNILSESSDSLIADAENTIAIQFHLAATADFTTKLFTTSCSTFFLQEAEQLEGWKADGTYKNEIDLFKALGLHNIPPFLRETGAVIQYAASAPIPPVIQTSDIRGLIHSHSNWSDGAQTIEEMAEALIATGFEYLVISDHSKAAFYAGGLTVDRIREQHAYIDALNKKLAPFRIFKGIECDILSDGALDYDDDVLASFDIVIASIHSNLQMKEEKAMMRLLRALENPYITVLGHMTGRRLLKRPAYPVDHAAIIDACVAQGVVIEINANPQRLDMKWEWVTYAREKNLLLSINPDAHTIDEFKNIRYGVLTAQKGGLTAGENMSSFTLEQMERFLTERKKIKGI